MLDGDGRQASSGGQRGRGAGWSWAIVRSLFATAGLVAALGNCSGKESGQVAQDSAGEISALELRGGETCDIQDWQDGKGPKEAEQEDAEELNDRTDSFPNDDAVVFPPDGESTDADVVGDIGDEAEALSARGGDGKDSSEEDEPPFWEGWWTDDVPWNPGVCESEDEGYLPGGLKERPCNVLIDDIVGKPHGFVLMQVERLKEAPCMLPECMEGHGLGGFLIRVCWLDKAAEPSQWTFCDYDAGPCPWPEPLPCKNHKFPAKVKVYWLDLETRQLHFVRNEGKLIKGMYGQCWNACVGIGKACKGGSLVLSEDLCAVASTQKGVCPMPYAWAPFLYYLCWDETLADNSQMHICLIRKLQLDGCSAPGCINYDVLANDLMTDDYTSVKCFAVIDGECVNLPLGLP